MLDLIRLPILLAKLAFSALRVVLAILAMPEAARRDQEAKNAD